MPAARIPTSTHARKPANDHRRSVGRAGETLAAEHLTRLGFKILARNVRTRHGEIDLIAFDGHTLTFVEVKSRRASSRAIPQADSEQTPLGGLRRRQQVRLRALATAWLSAPRAERPAAREIRFDAIGVTLDARDRLLRLDHLEAAW
jgi:putative endonuclease